jgi:hypothetical protein
MSEGRAKDRPEGRPVFTLPQDFRGGIRIVSADADHDAVREPFSDPQRTSYVRLRVDRHPSFGGCVEWLDARQVIDELVEDHAILTAKLEALDQVIGRYAAQRQTLRGVVALEASSRDLWNVRDLLGALLLPATSPSVQPALRPDMPCAEYLRGLVAWILYVVEAFETLVAGWPNKQPDWTRCQHQLELARNFHFDELEEAIGHELGWLEGVAGDPESLVQFSETFDELLLEARELEDRLDERFV